MLIKGQRSCFQYAKEVYPDDNPNLVKQYKDNALMIEQVSSSSVAFFPMSKKNWMFFVDLRRVLSFFQLITDILGIHRQSPGSSDGPFY